MVGHCILLSTRVFRARSRIERRSFVDPAQACKMEKKSDETIYFVRWLASRLPKACKANKKCEIYWSGKANSRANWARQSLPL